MRWVKCEGAGPGATLLTHIKEPAPRTVHPPKVGGRRFDDDFQAG
jgi:hypothetical protein